jgi:hypothetical protein
MARSRGRHAVSHRSHQPEDDGALTRLYVARAREPPRHAPLADRFADADEGVNSIVQEMTGVLHDGDPLPSDASPCTTTRATDGWRAARRPCRSGSSFPASDCGRWASTTNRACRKSPRHARDVSGTLRVAVQLILQESDTADAAAIGMYLLRAMRGVIARFDDPSNYKTCANSAAFACELATSISARGRSTPRSATRSSHPARSCSPTRSSKPFRCPCLFTKSTPMTILSGYTAPCRPTSCWGRW